MRAISPVIATVIIVAIAISIAVALWLTGITSGFTQTENLQIVSSYAQVGNYYNFTVNNTKPLNYTLLFGVGNYYWGLYTNNWTSFNLTYPNVAKATINVTNLVHGSSWFPSKNGTDGWVIRIMIKNTGTVQATIDNIFINNVPLSNAAGVVCYNGTSASIASGKELQILIFLESGTHFSSGQMVNIKIHTASGRDYPTTITLP